MPHSIPPVNLVRTHKTQSLLTTTSIICYGQVTIISYLDWSPSCHPCTASQGVALRLKTLQVFPPYSESLRLGSMWCVLLPIPHGPGAPPPWVMLAHCPLAWWPHLAWWPLRSLWRSKPDPTWGHLYLSFPLPGMLCPQVSLITFQPCTQATLSELPFPTTLYKIVTIHLLPAFLLQRRLQYSCSSASSTVTWPSQKARIAILKNCHCHLVLFIARAKQIVVE